MDAGSLSIFSRLISMGSSSLLQYVSESFPWTADPANRALHRVLALAHEEHDETVRLTRLLQKKHLPLPASGYPSHFTNYNFCALAFMLAKLIVEHEKEIAELQAKLHLAEDEEVLKQAQGYLDLKREHLRSLQELLA